MLPEMNNIVRVINEPLPLNDLLLIPWFNFHNPDLLKEAMKVAMVDNPIIFTHTDPDTLSDSMKDIIGDSKLITGHIHQPFSDWKRGVVVTGSFVPIDFSDTNSERGFWTMSRTLVVNSKNDFKIDFHPLLSSIQFYTINIEDLNEDIVSKFKQDDYIDVRVSIEQVEKYNKQILELRKKFNVIISYVISESGSETSVEYKEILDVDRACENLIPEPLRELYIEMRDSFNETKS
jgi:hypothetical protein